MASLKAKTIEKSLFRFQTEGSGWSVLNSGRHPYELLSVILVKLRDHNRILLWSLDPTNFTQGKLTRVSMHPLHSPFSITYKSSMSLCYLPENKSSVYRKSSSLRFPVLQFWSIRLIGWVMSYIPPHPPLVKIGPCLVRPVVTSSPTSVSHTTAVNLSMWCTMLI